MENIIAIPAITVLCYVGAELLKAFVLSEDRYKNIPVLCALLGVILGVVSHLWLPGYIPAENVIAASAVGAVSGWAATGVNQVIKQMGGGQQ